VYRPGDVRESLRMIDSDRINKIDEVTHFEILYVKAYIPLSSFSRRMKYAESDGIVDLLSPDQVRIVNEIVMKGVEP
jgi:hypothetical protein